MTRSSRPYAAGAASRRTFAGFNTDIPTAGFYRLALRGGAAPAAIRVWYGPPHDPVTGEEMDRSWRWQAEANGEPIDLEQVWPRCARQIITEAEHDMMCRKARWAREHAPDSALADPRRVVDPLNSPLPF
ncbi:hypothetical protein [Sphingopyxis flava]|uniref:Uncharacterized protein n=1 Tax=Sphingopyxis flava TaxID=1507287 RepID=A0A1T5ADG4_9SPHN|nr:hypothetical protein [Sphingopyxis flava]SKB32777.1 hypothetical protein SAMN06295937_1003108 [Sphingopyxis flava]